MAEFVLTVELETRDMAGKKTLLCINKPDDSGNSGSLSTCCQ